MRRGRTPPPAANGATPTPTPARSRVEERRPQPNRRAASLLTAPPGSERIGWQDETGRWWAVLVPEGRPDLAEVGVVIGPPEGLSGRLALPEGTAVALHNELYHRGLLTLADVQRRQPEVLAALQAALRVDVAAIVAVYRGDYEVEEGNDHDDQDAAV